MSEVPANQAEIYVYALQTREPFFDAFEVAMYDAPEGTLLNFLSAPGSYKKDLDLWTQDGLMFFEALTRGTTYWFRARVRARGGTYSAWSAWQSEVAGDTTAPASNYATAALYSDGQVRVTATVTGADADVDHYEVKTQINDASTPTAATLATYPDLRRTGTAVVFDIQMAQTDAGYAWIRAVDTSGNRQVWTALHPGGGFSLIVENVVINSTLQTTITVGKNLEAIIQFTYSAPGDARFGGVELWMANYRNLGKLERVGRYAAQTPSGSNSFKIQIPLDYGGPIIGVAAHTVTFYLAAFTVENILRLPVTSAPSTAFNPGITGAYGGPGIPGSFSVFQIGVGFSVSWLDNGDPNTCQYLIYRQYVGTHASPVSPDFSLSNHVHTEDKYIAVTAGAGPFYRWFDSGGFTALDVDPANPKRIAYWVAAMAMDGTESSVNGPVVAELLTNGGGDQDNEEQEATVNLLYNADLYARDVGGADVAMTDIVTLPLVMTGITQANPAQVTTAANHGRAVGDLVAISYVDGVAFPYSWLVEVVQIVNATVFKVGLDLTLSVGPLTPGNVGKLEGQPARDLMLPGGYGAVLGVFDYPWQNVTGPGAANATKWKSDGTAGTGEVLFEDPGAGKYRGMVATMNFRRFAKGLHLILSVYACMPTAGTGKLRMGIDFSDGSGFFMFEFDSSLLLTTYQRFAANIAVPDTAYATPYIRFVLQNYNVSSGSAAGQIMVNRPEINIGDNLTMWTSDRGGIGTREPGQRRLAPVVVPRSRRSMAGFIQRHNSIVYF